MQQWLFYLVNRVESKKLYIINPICAEYAPPQFTFNLEHCGAEIHFYLTSRLAVIEDELRYHLKNLYSTPNRAFYAAAEEFYDRLIFASDRKGSTVINMSSVWGQFFQEYSKALCTTDYEAFQHANELVDRYKQMTKELEDFAAGKEAEAQ